MDELYIQIEGELFEAVQSSSVFQDSKTFPDCCPLHHPETVLQKYREQQTRDDFDLKLFILANFNCPEEIQA